MPLRELIRPRDLFVAALITIDLVGGACLVGRFYRQAVGFVAFERLMIR